MICRLRRRLMIEQSQQRFTRCGALFSQLTLRCLALFRHRLPQLVIFVKRFLVALLKVCVESQQVIVLIVQPSIGSILLCATPFGFAEPPLQNFGSFERVEQKAVRDFVICLQRQFKRIIVESRKKRL